MTTASDRLCLRSLLVLSVVAGLLLPVGAACPAPPSDSGGEWTRLTKDLATLGLPSRFLRVLPVEFVKLEFADLKIVAAEYHPEAHRMIFNLPLSVDKQGHRFRPLREVSHQDLATIYHELFHAYFDYIDFAAGTPALPAEDAQLHDAAKRLLACRYTMVDVLVSPAQTGQRRRGRVEQRRLSEREGWDALNETWAVLIGWAIWNKLEVTNHLTQRWNGTVVEKFWDRLGDAYGTRELAGYFEPEDLDARKIVPRWYLAPSSGISVPEIALLLETILGESHRMAESATERISSEKSGETEPGPTSC